MVSERLTQTLNFIGASNSDIAWYAGIDTSLVSRLKSGSRVVKAKSVTVSKIADGIYKYCIEKKLLPAFCSLFGGEGSKKEITAQFILWLFEGVPEYDEKKKRKAASTVISTRLDKLMRLADMSNIRLARAINIDSSYISRIRSGVRTPTSNLELIRSISEALSDRITEKGKIQEAARLMGASVEIPGDSSDIKDILYLWLSDTKPESLLPAAEILLDKIESFSPDASFPLPDISLLQDDVQGDNASTYRGTDGLRRAVTRFLLDASKDGGNELWLYSDQDMGWMVGDESFRLKWFALMTECARNGVKIKIIHNIDRDLNEMIAAITSWLPLYMSGTIEPYYCTKRMDDRFSHTIFLCRGKAGIYSCHIRGYEETGFYDYYTDSERLGFIEDEYNGMIKISRPLVKMYGSGSYSELNADTKFWKNRSSVSEAPSIATMPRELINSILDRAEIYGGDREKIIERRKIERASFEAALQNGYVHELIPPAADEQILSGNILSDLGEGIYYSYEEFEAHRKNILLLMEQHTNYRVYILPEAPFSNISVTADRNRVVVSRRNTPRLSFVFTHPLMISAFDSYILRLKRKNMLLLP